MSPNLTHLQTKKEKKKTKKLYLNLNSVQFKITIMNLIFSFFYPEIIKIYHFVSVFGIARMEETNESENLPV